MRTNFFLKNLILVLFAVSSVACAQSDAIGGQPNAANADTVTIYTDTSKHIFQIELADEDEERRLGLMYRTEMAEDAGMLFDFETPQPISMWMKNTLIPLDMAFINEDGIIMRIAPNTTPRSLTSIHSGSHVVAVLEVNGGTFERLNIKEGDRVEHGIFN